MYPICFCPFLTSAAETILLQSESENRTEQKEFIQLVFQKIKQVEKMVKQLFELSKMDSPGFKPNKEPFLFSDILQENISAYSTSFISKNIVIKCAGCNDTSWVLADVSMMERVIQNLLVNALKYTPENGSLRIELATQNRELVLRMHNSGRPVSGDVQQWINAGSADTELRTKPAQTGFGLLIIKKILQLHGFTFEVSTPAEEGNCFILAMPLHLFTLSKN